jgi:phage gp29-like protein
MPRTNLDRTPILRYEEMLDRIYQAQPKPGVPTGKPDLSEVMFADPRRLYRGQFTIYNPNVLVMRQGLEVFDKMRRDDQVKAALTFKKYAVISAGWEIVSPKDEAEDWEVTDSLRKNFDDITTDERTFDDILIEVLSALDYGYSVSEKIWEEKETPNGSQIWLKDLKTRKPHYIHFQQDPQGNLLKVMQEVPAGEKPDTKTAYGPMIEVPQEKILLYVHHREFSNYYGTSDLDAAYRAWVVKDNAYKWLAMYLEKLGIPPIFAIFNPEAYTGTPIQTMQTVLERMQSATIGMMPRPNKDDLEFWSPELGTQANSVFIPALDMLNRDIARAILMPNLLGFTAESQHGSFARSNTQFDMFLMVIDYIRRTVSSAINAQVIRPWVDFNYGTQERYPEFRFLPQDDEARVQLLQSWTQMITAGAVTKQQSDETAIRQLLKMPERQEGDEMPVSGGINPATGLPIGQVDPKTGLPINSAPQPKRDSQGKIVKDKNGKPVMQEPTNPPVDAGGNPIGPPAAKTDKAAANDTSDKGKEADATDTSAKDGAAASDAGRDGTEQGDTKAAAPKSKAKALPQKDSKEADSTKEDATAGDNSTESDKGTADKASKEDDTESEQKPKPKGKAKSDGKGSANGDNQPSNDAAATETDSAPTPGNEDDAKQAKEIEDLQKQIKDLLDAGKVQDARALLKKVVSKYAQHMVARAFGFDPDEPRDETGKWSEGGGGFKDLYHGTAAAFVDKIISEGLKPGGGKGNKELYKGERGNAVFLTDNEEKAKGWALLAAPEGPELLELDKQMPDASAEKTAKKQEIYRKYRTAVVHVRMPISEYKSRVKVDKIARREGRGGAYYVVGSIPSKYIASIKVRQEGSADYKEVKFAMGQEKNYIDSYAVAVLGKNGEYELIDPAVLPKP